MSKLLLVAPQAFAAACVSDPPTSIGANVQDAVDPVPASGDGTPTLYGSFETIPDSCDEHSLLFTAHPFYSDGSPTTNVTCEFQFPDGSTIEGCGGSHSVPDLTLVKLVLRDTVTGATRESEDLVQGPASYSVSVDVTTSGDTLTWHAHTLYGTQVNRGLIEVSIDPAANVVEQDVLLFRQFDGTVHVTADGTYTVTVNAAVNFPEYTACDRSASASGDVDCSGGNGI